MPPDPPCHGTIPDIAPETIKFDYICNSYTLGYDIKLVFPGYQNDYCSKINSPAKYSGPPDSTEIIDFPSSPGGISNSFIVTSNKKGDIISWD